MGVKRKTDTMKLIIGTLLCFVALAHSQQYQTKQELYGRQQNQYEPDLYAGQYEQYDQYENIQPQQYQKRPSYQQEEEEYVPKPFAYEYGGADSSGRHFAKTETSDDDGVVKGEYRVELPDGRVQIVSYTADPVNGYQADVRYEGEAKPYVPEEQGYDEPRQKYVPQHKPYARRY